MVNSFRIVAIIALIFCSAFFSASEIAFAGTNAVRLNSRYKNKESLSLKLALKILADYDENLTTILVSNILVNTAASSVATVIVLEMGLPSVVATVVMTVVILLFGEAVPKVLAKQMSEQFCYFSAIPLYVLSVIFKPLSFVMTGIVKLCSRIWKTGVSDVDAVSEEDFEKIIDIVEDEGVLDEEQCDLLQNALDFDEVLAYEIITPRVDMTALDIRAPFEVNLKKIGESSYSRLPVYEETTDNIIGVLHLNHFYKALVTNEKVNIRDLLLPVTFVHKTMPLDDVLEKMKENKTHMAVVSDEYGGTMGIVTMEDVLEQLVGEIFDENDEIEREFISIDETHYEADGSMRIYDFFDELDIDVDDEESLEDTATLGGWVITMLDGEANEGDSFTFENLIITVKKTDARRVEKLLVEEIIMDEED